MNQNFRVYFYVTELELDSRLLVKLKQFMVERGDVRFEYIEDRPMVSRVGRKEGGREGDGYDDGRDGHDDYDKSSLQYHHHHNHGCVDINLFVYVGIYVCMTIENGEVVCIGVVGAAARVEG